MDNLPSREHRSREGGSRFDIGGASSSSQLPQTSAGQVERVASSGVDATANPLTTQADISGNPELTQKVTSLLD